MQNDAPPEKLPSQHLVQTPWEYVSEKLLPIHAEFTHHDAFLALHFPHREQLKAVLECDETISPIQEALLHRVFLTNGFAQEEYEIKKKKANLIRIDRADYAKPLTPITPPPLEPLQEVPLS